MKPPLRGHFRQESPVGANQKALIASVHFFLDAGYMLEQQPHQDRQYLHNILAPKSLDQLTSCCLYFGTNTKWYLQSHLTWDKLSQSCIDSSSFMPLGLSWRMSLYHFTPDRQNLFGSSTRGGGFKPVLTLVSS